MSMNGKTIQIFLPAGQPRGVRIAEMTTRIVQAIQFPRTLMSEAFMRPESANVALYFLFGVRENDAQPIAYIGQTEDLRTRLRTHSNDKDFWQAAVFITSRTQSFTQAHIRYLEWHSIAAARDAGRFLLDNGNEGFEPYVPEWMKADLFDIFDTASVLLSTLGFPIFEALATPTTRPDSPQVFECRGPDTSARGQLVEDGFVVLRGSVARVQLVPSAQGWIIGLRQQLTESGVLVPQDGKLILSKDHLFDSPSAAAAAMPGRSANGWDSWLHADGRTLHDVYRAEK